jgi:hypothetical protein
MRHLKGEGMRLFPIWQMETKEMATFIEKYYDEKNTDNDTKLLFIIEDFRGIKEIIWQSINDFANSIENDNFCYTVVTKETVLADRYIDLDKQDQWDEDDWEEFRVYFEHAEEKIIEALKNGGEVVNVGEEFYLKEDAPDLIDAAFEYLDKPHVWVCDKDHLHYLS